MQWSFKRTQRIEEKIALVEMMAAADFEPEVIEERIAYLMRSIRIDPEVASGKNMWKEYEFIRLCELFHRMSLAIQSGFTSRPYWSLYQEMLWDLRRMLVQQQKQLENDETKQCRDRRRNANVKLPLTLVKLGGK